MTWKKVGEFYERSCCHCAGKGVERVDNFSHCPCPMENVDLINHPANSVNESDRRGHSISHKLVRCNACGNIWLIYCKTMEDSWDVPGPEFVGRQIPPDDWRPGVKV